MSRVRFSDLCHFTAKQWQATEAADSHRYTLFGGSRGPGKSYWLRWYLVRFLIVAAGQVAWVTAEDVEAVTAAGV